MVAAVLMGLGLWLRAARESSQVPSAAAPAVKASAPAAVPPTSAPAPPPLDAGETLQPDTAPARFAGYCDGNARAANQLRWSQQQIEPDADKEALMLAAVRGDESDADAALALAQYTLGLMWRLSGDASPALLARLRKYAARDDARLEVVRLVARIDLLERFEASARTATARGVTLVYSGAKTTDGEAAAVAERIAQALDEAAALTQTTRRPSLKAVLYVSRSVFLASTCEADDVLAFYSRGVLHVAYPSLESREVLDTDIRHEVMHAQLSFVEPRTPLWFHEGLAHLFGGRPTLQRATEMLRRPETGPMPYEQLDAVIARPPNNREVSRARFESMVLVDLLSRRRGRAALWESLQQFKTVTGPAEVVRAVTATAAPSPEALVQ